ncbi:MAG TPA: hypothetical protein VGC06_23700 [Actinomycetes bacterium]
MPRRRPGQACRPALLAQALRLACIALIVAGVVGLNLAGGH